MKLVSVLGSTGSVGQNTLKVLQAQGEGVYQVQALTAYKNWQILAEQAKATKARFAVIGDEAHLSLIHI